MLCELVTAVMLIWLRPDGVSDWLVWTGLMLLGSCWIMTYGIQVPQHTSLALAYDPSVQRQLVAGNWGRTAAWSSRGVLVLWMLAQAMQDGCSIKSVDLVQGW